ncbi:unnamed protein product (macronuclear) [Paramecium tetraurelia]|uniref:Protein kinase domain-containing protein n=1 Tax=Paramecium tetraurelia TaxID=5888 RepID=A0D3J7_PARTE|nr:uncharacterized protein GSPATT00013102001 [Paramecium tetraurelia]CAK77614.1 unnamed protein product [Paramecium tetraurelia]|eukprot:XP_001445011.1 hypothetical protein (macronuclear) [Paramecium tetraurelia strain d4-2]
MTSQYDYSKIQFECVVLRKHFIRDVKYYCYVLDKYLLMSTKPKDEKPKYVLFLQLSQQVGWITEQKDNKLIIKALTIRYQSKFKDFTGKTEDLHIIRQQIKNKVTFVKISDFYEAQYNLGKGSSAKVIQIKEIGSESTLLAAKAIDKHYLQKSQFGMKAFLNEVEILNLLNKQCINAPFIKLYETFEGDYTYYLILDLMQGRTLAEEMELWKELFPIKSVRIIMQQLLEGVRILHENNIIHRDLKPDNIMFREQDQYDTLIIVDFGLSTFTEVSKYQFPKCGTPGYVAPEVLNLIDRDQKYDKVCDVFSCGCIFYKLLFGHSLFYGNSFNEVLAQNKKCNFILDGRDMDMIPLDAQQLLKRMLAKNPLERITAKQALESDFFICPVTQSQQNISKMLKTNNSSNIFQPTTEGQLSEADSPFQRVQNTNNEQIDFDSDISENKSSSIQIRQLPSVKKPSFSKMEETNLDSFYTKDPLSSFKKINAISLKSLNESQDNKIYQSEIDQMQRISLFNRYKDN